MSHDRVIAVTGATGFLGRHLLRALAQTGCRLRILARREPSAELERGDALEVIPGHLEDPDALTRLASGADAVVHVAGLIKALSGAPYWQVNRDGTRAIAAATARDAPAARLVVVSSLAAREPGLSEYASSKRAGEEAARAVFRGRLDRLVIVRPPLIYGPGDRETLAIFKAASRRFVPIAGAGRLAIVHVADAAAAITQLALGVGEPGLYALADDNPAGYAIRDLMLHAARAVGRTPRFVRIPRGALLAAGRISTWHGRWRQVAPTFSAGKAREILHPDWSVGAPELLPHAIHRPQVGIAEGFRETVAWYRSARWLD